MRENRPYGSEGGEQRYCSPTPIEKAARHARSGLDSGLRRSDEGGCHIIARTARFERGET